MKQKIRLLLSVFILLLTLVGCGTKDLSTETLNKRLNSLQMQYDSLQSKYTDLTSEYEELQSEYEALKKDYDELEELYNSQNEVTYDSPTDLSEYDTNITYEQLARTPDDYEGKAVCFTGEVVQVLEDEDEIQIRLAIDGDYDKMIIIGYEPSIMNERILENDNITIYGLSVGIFTYESSLNVPISIPAVWVDHIELNK